MKILSVGAELLHAGARKDRQEEAQRRFSQFCGRALNKRGKTGSERSMNHHTVCVCVCVCACARALVCLANGLEQK